MRRQHNHAACVSSFSIIQLRRCACGTGYRVVADALGNVAAMPMAGGDAVDGTGAPCATYYGAVVGESYDAAAGTGYIAFALKGTGSALAGLSDGDFLFASFTQLQTNMYVNSAQCLYAFSTAFVEPPPAPPLPPAPQPGTGGQPAAATARGCRI
jgi:hypothetical protein